MNPEFLDQLVNATTLGALAPFLAVCAGAMFLLLADIVPGAKTLRAPLFLATIAIAAFYEVRLLDAPKVELFSNSFVSSPQTALWGLLFLASALLAWCFAHDYYDEERAFLAEHDVLMLCSAAGMMLMAGAQDLLTFFVGLELLSVPLYTLAGFQRTKNASVEAGLKYFVLGAFAAAIFLYGAALLYTGTGSISLYGTTYTQFNVVTNGRVTLGATPNTQFTPSNPAVSQPPPQHLVAAHSMLCFPSR